MAIYVAHAPGQKRGNSTPLGFTASYPQGMLCVWGWGLGSVLARMPWGQPKGGMPALLHCQNTRYTCVLLFGRLCLMNRGSAALSCDFHLWR